MKKLISLLITGMMLVSGTTMAFAEEENLNQEKADKLNPGMELSSKNISPYELYQYHWRIKKVTKGTLAMGSWRYGPSGTGPGQVSMSNSQSYDRSFTTSISGNYDIGKAVIGAQLGVTIGETKSYSTGFSIPVSAGETKTIKYRPKYYPYSVESEYLKVSNSTGSTTVIKTQTAKVNVFNDWDYGWGYGILGK